MIKFGFRSFFIHADEPTGCSGDFHWRIWRIWQVRCFGECFLVLKQTWWICGERWRKLVQSKWGSTNIRIQTCLFRFHWNVMLWCKRDFAAHDVDEVFPSSSIQPSPFLQGWWNYPYWILERWNNRHVCRFSETFSLYQCSVWVGNDMYFLNGLVTPGRVARSQHQVKPGQGNLNVVSDSKNSPGLYQSPKEPNSNWWMVGWNN